LWGSGLNQGEDEETDYPEGGKARVVDNVEDNDLHPGTGGSEISIN